jgi:hypothetical protein
MENSRFIMNHENYFDYYSNIKIDKSFGLFSTSKKRFQFAVSKYTRKRLDKARDGEK